MYSKETNQGLYFIQQTPGLRRYSMETEKIIKRYCSQDKVTKEHMWYSHPNLRTQFDYLEKKDALFQSQKGKVPGIKEEGGSAA